MTRICLFALGVATTIGCSSSVDVSRNSGSSTDVPDGSTTTRDGSATAPDRSTTTPDGPTTIVDVWTPPVQHIVDGMVCEPVHPTTPSGTCPVMPRGGTLCAPPAGPIDPCAGRGMCGYGIGPGIPERNCPTAVCADERGNCPPPESVCAPVESCAIATDCQGDQPGHQCIACPLSPDGTQTVSCSHWACTDGKCAIGAPCGERTDLTCPGGHGCPSYYFPAFDKTCASDADCAVFDHFESCCTTRVIGVSIHDKARVQAAEAECNGLLDQFARRCGCQPMRPAEDGSLPYGGQEIVGACIAGTCKGVVRGRIQCGAITCAEGESCCGGADAQGYCISFCAATCPVAPGCTIPQ